MKANSIRPYPTTPSRWASESVTTTEVVAEPAECEASYTLTDTWSTGYQVAVTVTNRGSENMAGWVVTWTLPGGQRISNLWNGSFSQSGAAVSVTSASYNGTLAPGAAATVGFTATASSTGAAPSVSCS